MCGIFCSLSTKTHVCPTPELQQLLENRGPDSHGKKLSTITRKAANGSTEDVHLVCWSTVLSLRGSVTVNQPYQEDTSGSTLCWNGEAWSIAGVSTDGNDTKAVFHLLSTALGTKTESASRNEFVSTRLGLVSQTLSQVAGPYGFVFHDKANDLLFFGRDFLGRRSLARKTTADGEIIFTSVTDGDASAEWSEVDADGVYCIDLQAPADNAENGDVQQWGQFQVTRASYDFIDRDNVENKSVIPRLSLNKTIEEQSTLLNDASPSVLALENMLRESLSERVLKIPQPPTRNDHSDTSKRPAKLAILFSGGLDCTMLARLSHDIHPYSEPIDLLNVAFENPRVHKPGKIDPNIGPYELCPDRTTGRASFSELQQVCPNRNWRFVAINVPYTETLEYRQKVTTLMHPHNTEMDLSICSALYFAARGQGLISSKNGETLEYTTSARVLLSGLGADELFGGYTRHATAYRRHGMTGLIDELDLDIARLGKRNLGRDDRTMSNWSREIRFPFLDERLVEWALAAPAGDKCDFAAMIANEIAEDGESSERLEAGKKVLRCLAWKLGMKAVAKEKKRAIQFGARTAKMETGKTKGTTLLT